MSKSHLVANGDAARCHSNTNTNTRATGAGPAALCVHPTDRGVLYMVAVVRGTGWANRQRPVSATSYTIFTIH